MRKLKLFSLIAITALTLAIATGCSNKGSENKTEQTTTETTNNETEQSNESNESSEQGSTFQTLDTTDINGEKVTKDIFKGKKLTLVNIWATWCSPCVEEIPVLGELAKEYKDSDVSIKGLLVEIDGETGEFKTGISEEEKKTANGILKDTGATYQQLLVSESMKQQLSTVTAFPTTYFVDENGEIIGNEILGANTKEGWKAEIEKRLKMVEEK